MNKQREVHLALQLEQQVDDLRSDRDVERGDRLVADDELRLQRDRARDPDALPLSARELVREAIRRARRQPDSLEQLGDPDAARTPQSPRP